MDKTYWTGNGKTPRASDSGNWSNGVPDDKKQATFGKEITSRVEFDWDIRGDFSFVCECDPKLIIPTLNYCIYIGGSPWISEELERHVAAITVSVDGKTLDRPPPEHFASRQFTYEEWQLARQDPRWTNNDSTRSWYFDGSYMFDYFAISPGKGPDFHTAYVDTQNGAWNAVATWGGGGFPIAGDTVQVHQFKVTLTANAACTSMVVSASPGGAIYGWVEVDTYTFTTTGNVDIGTNPGGLLTVGAGANVHIGGAVTMKQESVLGTTATAYTLQIDGNLTHNAVGVLESVINAPNAAGSFIYGGTVWQQSQEFHSNGGTVVFNAGATVTLTRSTELVTMGNRLNSITLNAGTTLDTSAASNYKLSLIANIDVSGTLTTNLSIILVGGSTTINAGGAFGASAAYTLILTGSLSVTAGTLDLPNAGGTTTMEGATWAEGGTVNANSGIVTFNRAGTTTLGSAATNFNEIFISVGSTLDTSAASSYGLSVAAATIVQGVLTCNGSTAALSSLTTSAAGVVNGNTAAISLTANWDTHLAAACWVCNTSTVTFKAGGDQTVNTASSFYNAATATASTALAQASAITVSNTTTIATATSWSCVTYSGSFGSGITIAYGLTINGTGTFNGGNHPNTFGSINASAGASTIIMTSDAATFDGVSGTTVLALKNTTTFTHSNGIVMFTYAGTQRLFDSAGTARTFYTLIVNKGVGNWLEFAANKGFNITVANELTVTSGTFTTQEIVGIGRDLTVVGLTYVAGQLDLNASTVILRTGAAGATAVNVLGTLNCGSATMTIGNMNVGAAGTLNMGSAGIEVNGTDAAGYGWRHTAGATYDVGSSIVYSSASHKINPTFWDYEVLLGTVTLTEAMVVNNDFQISLGGTLDTSPDAGLTSYAVTVGNATSIRGTFTGRGSTVTLVSLLVDAGGVYSAPTVITYVSTTFEVNATGTFTHNGGVLNFNGVVPQVITIPAGAFSFGSITVSALADVTTSKMVKVMGGLVGALTMDQAPSADTLTVTGNLVILGTLHCAPVSVFHCAPDTGALAGAAFPFFTGVST